jgi:hypothetical protein
LITAVNLIGKKAPNIYLFFIPRARRRAVERLLALPVKQFVTTDTIPIR